MRAIICSSLPIERRRSISAQQIPTQESDPGDPPKSYQIPDPALEDIYGTGRFQPPEQTLFTNVNVFNGTENRLHEHHSVLVEGNLISAISTGQIKTNADATVIDGQGKTLMPGLIDSHVHFNLSMSGRRLAMESSRWDFIAVMGAAAAQDWLADGFATARDML